MDAARLYPGLAQERASRNTAPRGIEKPQLVVTVDTEEAFNWGHPFSRFANNVSATACQHRAHDIFSRHGIKPVYLVDYPVASQRSGYAPLQELLADGLCEIGTQLHPWVNPPFVETVSAHNSFPCNLPRELEHEKLRVLTAALEDAFNLKPRIYRAGRYGFGHNTPDILKALGYQVDTSMVPGWNFAAQGGLDYRSITSAPFWLDGGRGLLEMPIAASVVGRAAGLNPAVLRHLFDRPAERFRLPAIMARLKLLERIKLTPEGITIDEAKRLTRHMAMHGHKVFVLTYHSPSLEPGNTPYVRTADDLRRFLGWLDEFFHFFVTEIGGEPASWARIYAALSENGELPAGGKVLPMELGRGGAAPRLAPIANDAESAAGKADAPSPVLMIAYHYPPENTIGSARPHRMARYLMRSGYPVTVIASHLPDLADAAAEVVRVPVPDRPNRKAQWASALGRTIERVALPYNDRLPWVGHALAAASAALKADPNRIVLSTHPPVATHLVALALKWRYGMPWIADFRDPLHGNAYRVARRAAMIDPVLERLIFRYADAVIANTDSVVALWRERYSEWSDKIHLIWNGFDPEDEIVPLPIARRERRRIAHVGTIYGQRSPDRLVESLDRLVSSGRLSPESFQLRLTGPIQNVSLAPENPAVHRLMAQGCLYVDNQMVPKPQARREILEADYLVLLDMTSGDNAGRQLPAKIFDYIRAQRPILAFTARDSVTERILRRSGLGFAAIDPATPPDAMDAQVESFLAAPLAETCPAPAFCREFDARHQTDQLIGIMSRLSTSAKPSRKFNGAGL